MLEKLKEFAAILSEDTAGSYAVKEGYDDLRQVVIEEIEQQVVRLYWEAKQQCTKSENSSGK